MKRATDGFAQIFWGATPMPASMSNPVFRETIFDRAHQDAPASTMTVQGTAIKTMILLAILLATAAFTWSQTLAPASLADETSNVIPHFQVVGNPIIYVILGLVGGLIFALITTFVPRISPWTAPCYAACEGLALGGISAFFESVYPGIVLDAVALTLGTLATMLAVYAFRIITVTDKFRMMVVAATGAIAIVYFATWILNMFGVPMPYLHASGLSGGRGGLISIGFSVVVVVVATLNLLLDFDFIERCARQGAPRYMEWYSGFGLLVTLVWLYLEILRLLSKLRDRR
jgi:uncharacterized YccA/Bax inhibitor family protein